MFKIEMIKTIITLIIVEDDFLSAPIFIWIFCTSREAIAAVFFDFPCVEDMPDNDAFWVVDGFFFVSRMKKLRNRTRNMIHSSDIMLWIFHYSESNIRYYYLGMMQSADRIVHYTVLKILRLLLHGMCSIYCYFAWNLIGSIYLQDP